MDMHVMSLEFKVYDEITRVWGGRQGRERGRDSGLATMTVNLNSQ